MPTYDYECRSCGHTFEAFQAMSEEPLRVCPQCQGELRRLIGGGMGIIFKGSGFYVNDSRQEGAKKPASEGKKEKNGKDAQPASAEGCGSKDTRESKAAKAAKAAPPEGALKSPRS